MSRLLWLMCLLAMTVGAVLSPHPVLIGGICAFLLCPSVGWLALLPWGKKLRVELTVPSVGAKHETVCLKCCLKNGHKAPIGRVTVKLRLYNPVTGEQTEKRLSFSETGQWELSSDHCGCILCAVTQVRVREIFGIFSRRVPCTAKKRLTVLPDTFPILLSKSRPVGMTDSPEAYAPDRRGSDRTETFQIREYVPGDPLQQIHWKLSSKWEKLTVREPAHPIDRTLTVFLEQWDECRTPEQADCLLEAVTSVCQALTESGYAYRLCWNGETLQSMDVTGQEQLAEAVSAILKAERSAALTTGTALAQAEVIGGTVLYFCSRMADTPFPWANAHIFLCGEGTGDRVTAFTPENMHDQLKQIIWS